MSALRFNVVGSAAGAASIEIQGQLWAELRHLLCSYERVELWRLRLVAGRFSCKDTARDMGAACDRLGAEHGDGVCFVRG